MNDTAAGARPVEFQARPPLLLWSVRVVRAGYVLAESQEAAEELVREIERWEEPDIEVGSGSEDLGWTGDCYVYHKGNGDITLATARSKFEVA